MKHPIFCLILVFMFLSCGPKQGNNKKENNKQKPAKSTLFKLESPKNGKTFKGGETVAISYTNETNQPVDSCVLSVDGKRQLSFTAASHEAKTDEWRMGVRRLSLELYSGGTVLETLSFALKIIPKTAPTAYTYKVVREYPHDVKAYTQGLCYHNGFLYEGTGQLGSSSLRKVKLETGAVLQRIELDDQYFGEGICILGERIMQLTWQNHQGFIYKLDDFSLEGTFRYGTEGWGLTTDGQRMWMSDGTANLYLLNPTTMEVVDQLEVYSDKGPVLDLNELEYINNEIWANVYGADSLVRINPSTGEVTGTIDLEGILRKEYYKPDTDVLNGIAYDAAGGRIFVTGKNWPKLFEIKVTAK